MARATVSRSLPVAAFITFFLMAPLAWGQADFTKITDGEGSAYPSISADGHSIAFISESDPTGGNPDHKAQIFLWRDGVFTQITHITDIPTSEPNPALPVISGDGHSIA